MTAWKQCRAVHALCISTASVQWITGILPEITVISCMHDVFMCKSSELWMQLIQLERRTVSVFLESWSHDKSVCFNLYGPWNGNVKAYWHVDNSHTGTRCVGCSVCVCVCVAPAPRLLPFCLLSVTRSLSMADLRQGEAERSRLTFLCFPVNQDYSSYLMMQKQSNMTFKVTIL